MWKKIFQLISLLLFPITMYYFSPAIIIMGASEGIITGSFILFGILLIGSVFFGRLFCSTICPAGAVQDIIIGTIRDKKIRSDKIRYSKWIIFSLWLGIIIKLFFDAGGVTKVDPLYQTVNGVSISEPSGYIIYYIVIGIFLILPFVFGNRGACHTICWMSPFMITGSCIGKTLKIPSLRLIAEYEKCIKCGRCSRVCPMTINVSGKVAEKNVFSTDCILCGKCTKACPQSVLSIKFKA